VKRALVCILILIAVGVIRGLIAVFLVLPSMNWSATRKPGQMESSGRLASRVFLIAELFSTLSFYG
jgi:hypothetical protein